MNKIQIIRTICIGAVLSCISIYANGQNTTEIPQFGTKESPLSWASEPMAFIFYTISIILATAAITYYILHSKNKQNQQDKKEVTANNAPSRKEESPTFLKASESSVETKTVANNQSIETAVMNPENKIQEIVDAHNEPPTETDKKYKLLIIEDHKDIGMYLKILFSKEYTVYLAENGKKGIETAYEVSPDLIISDVMMPIMNGFELARTLKEDINTCHIPIILLTALTSDEDVMKGMELGADDYVMKPFNSGILKSKVKRLIKNRIELKKAYTKLLVTSTLDEVKETEEATEETKTSEDPLVAKALGLIADNIQNEDFSVKKLAEMLNMSQPTLYRKIKQLTNFTLIEIIRGVRLKKAAELLKTKNYNVQEVAEAVGYNDVPTFRKHFVDMYGVTPSAFSKEEA